MIRLVLDTNIVVSAILRAGSLPDTILKLGITQSVQLCLSEAIVAEYDEVLRRPRFALQPERVSSAIMNIREAGLLVRPVKRVTAAFDPDDNIFLECAEAADANFLITGNLKHFPPRWASTQIVTPRRFLEVLSEGADLTG
jgi:uncharacterized protein